MGNKIEITILRSASSNTILLFVSIILSAVLAEFALRIALPSPIVWKHPQERYVYDPDIGHWLEPGQASFTHDKAVIINSVGIRDFEYTEFPQPDVYRILALGDSQTFGNGLDLADTWPKKLQNLLNTNISETDVEVLNCGLPASDTWQHEIILRRMLDEYHPDAVVLAFYINDVVRRYIPKQIRKESPSPLKTSLIYILKQSSLFLSLRAAIDTIRNKIQPDKSVLREQALEFGEFNSGVEEGWQQVEESLAEMKNLTEKHGIDFLIIALPRRDQVSANTAQDAYGKRLREIAARQNIPVMSMLAALRQSGEGDDLFIPWDGHNSSVANQVIASETASWFREGKITSQ